MKKQSILIFTTTPTKTLAQKIAKILVKEKLAACVNISSPMQSVYSWKNKICSEKEFLLSIKTKKSLFKTVRDKILNLHSYEVPEIIALPITQGSSSYLEWIWKTLSKKSSKKN